MDAYMHEEDDAPPFGIVLLLDAPRVAEVEALAQSFSRATGRAVIPVIPDNPRAVRTGHLSPGDVVVAVPPTCVVHIDGTMFLVHSVDKPYFGDAEEVAQQLDVLREQQALLRHGAWISVELLHEEAISPENYRIVGKVTADLLGPDCLLLFHPESGGLMLPGPDTAAQLCSDTPLESVFGAASPEVPVVCVDDDPRLQEAAEEARRRFPEFARAFAEGAGEDFCVKARLEVGDDAEHIWIDVESIAGTVVRGQLGNNPVNLEGLSAGSPVHVDASAIEDWVFRRDGEPEGLFSVPILMAMRAERAGVTSSLVH